MCMRVGHPCLEVILYFLVPACRVALIIKAFTDEVTAAEHGVLFEATLAVLLLLNML
jgi:hypothetical protein